MKNIYSEVKSLVEYSASDEMIKTISAEYGMSESELREMLMNKKIESIIAQHKQEWAWWQNKNNGRWVTYIPDETRKEGRRQISAKDENDLIKKVVEFYKKRLDPERTLTLRILYPEWIEWKSNYGVSSKGRIKPQTIKRNRKDWNRYYAKTTIVDKPLKSLGSEELRLWVLDMIATHKMDKHQFANFHSIIAQMFEYAMEQKYITSNPFAEIKNLWNIPTEKDERPDEEMVFLNNEIQPFINYCWEQYNKDRYLVQKFIPLAVAFSFYTGVRKGELSALKFSDIHSNGLVIQRAVDDDHKVNRTKNGKARTVPLVPEALSLIEAVKRKRIELGLPIDGYIFSIDDEPFRVYVGIRRAVSKYCEELKMPIRSHHAIRRTFISVCLARGLSRKEVMDYVGHEDFTTTERSYFKNLFTPNEKASRLEKVLAF